MDGDEAQQDIFIAGFTCKLFHKRRPRGSRLQMSRCCFNPSRRPLQLETQTMIDEKCVLICVSGHVAEGRAERGIEI